jgi:DNA polymerase-1
MQNLPAKDDTIRLAVIPPPGYLILGVDYSQIELRILAALSQDPDMLEAYRTGKDIHSATAAYMFGYSYERVRQAEDVDNPTEEDHHIQNLRKGAKAVNFGIIYGESKYGLARGLGISVDEADAFIQKWF